MFHSSAAADQEYDSAQNILGGLVTAPMADAETKRQALENGAEALLTKPIDFGTLRSEIDVRVERAA
jgi:DNA-binding response OmpR family regulator